MEGEYANLCHLEHLVASQDELIEAVDGGPSRDRYGYSSSVYDEHSLKRV